MSCKHLHDGQNSLGLPDFIAISESDGGFLERLLGRCTCSSASPSSLLLVSKYRTPLSTWNGSLPNRSMSASWNLSLSRSRDFLHVRVWNLACAARRVLNLADPVSIRSSRWSQAHWSVFCSIWRMTNEELVLSMRSMFLLRIIQIPTRIDSRHSR